MALPFYPLQAKVCSKDAKPATETLRAGPAMTVNWGRNLTATARPRDEVIEPDPPLRYCVEPLRSSVVVFCVKRCGPSHRSAQGARAATRIFSHQPKRLLANVDQAKKKIAVRAVAIPTHKMTTPLNLKSNLDMAAPLSNRLGPPGIRTGSGRVRQTEMPDARGEGRNQTPEVRRGLV
jgi:hypothetical protein